MLGVFVVHSYSGTACLEHLQDSFTQGLIITFTVSYKYNSVHVRAYYVNVGWMSWTQMRRLEVGLTENSIINANKGRVISVNKLLSVGS